MEKHLYESGLIGNCAYLAHIHRNTNIVWLCWPRFDSSFVFGGLLDERKGGFFKIAPVHEKATRKQVYWPSANRKRVMRTLVSGPRT